MPQNQHSSSIKIRQPKIRLASEAEILHDFRQSMRNSTLSKKHDDWISSAKKPKKIMIPWDDQTILPDGKEILKESPKFEH
jgi:hypothetical protein